MYWTVIYVPKSKSQSKGKMFEQNFRSCVPDYCLLIRLNDSPASLKKSLRFTPSNPCDYLIWDSKHKLFIPVELKSTKYKSISLSMIRDNQIESLTKFADYDGVFPCFIFNFRDEENHNDRCYCQHINDFNKMISDINKKSFNELNLLSYGAIKIDGIKARVRWTWIIDGLMDKISERCSE